MMTVITRVSLKAGTEAEWDKAMRERLGNVQDQQGWVGGQMLIPAEGPNKRVIVGTGMSRGDWEAWHDDPAFKDTRERLEELQDKPDEMEWFEVAIEAREGKGV
jgi:heme-degrading monooxygenase HmoA